MTTQEEVDSDFADLELQQQDGTGILVGAVHNCDAFGLGNAIVLVNGSPEPVYYVEFWTIMDRSERTFTHQGDVSQELGGRFVVPNLQPGEVEVAAYARIEEGGPLVCIGKLTTEIEAGTISAVAIEPTRVMRL